jgi:subtilisin family serine protease
MLLWVGLAPLGVTTIAQPVLGDAISSGLRAAIVLAASGMVLIGPLLVVAYRARRRAGGDRQAALAGGLALVAGYMLLDGVVRALFPNSVGPSLHGEGIWAAVARLGALISYAFLVAWLAARLRIQATDSLAGRLGLRRPDLVVFLLALVVSALVTIPWPLTGALGDGLTSLSVAFQTLASTGPRVLILWGLLFEMIARAGTGSGRAAWWTILAYAVSAVGGVLPWADWGALQDVFVFLPLALLLAELRMRQGSVWSLAIVALCYHVAPSLFVDPRDAIAQGIPALQHVVSWAGVLVGTVMVAGVLWLVRRFAPQGRGLIRVRVTAVTLPVFWAAWAMAYLGLGEPGFANDGLLVIMETQADVSGAYAIPDRQQRLETVYTTLVDTAETTQEPVHAYLERRGVPFRPYYLVNMVRVDGHRWLKRALEQLPGVRQVILNPNVRRYPREILNPLPAAPDQVEGVQGNLAAVGADVAWDLGVTGAGIVVAGADTGYDWTHPALKPHYRGWNGTGGDHDSNWHDAWGRAAVPFDDDSHGTHTMGTLVGDDGAGNRIGVAPGARWIGCRAMQRGLGNPASYVECWEFFLAPYPHGGDPFSDGDVSMAPHVINNSWGCPGIEGCEADTLRPAAEALRAAGVMVIVGAGNEGPACKTVADPPARYGAVFSVGATNDDGRITGFSSRGPVDGLVKPDIAAPGAEVRSSVPGGGYASTPGTSMASPHVAGTVALVWSANAVLVGDIEATEELLCRTARSLPVEDACTADQGPAGLAGMVQNPVCACGGVTGSPNNVYGCGLIDAGAAARAALGQ